MSVRGSQRPYDPIATAKQLLDHRDPSSQASAVQVLSTLESQETTDKLTEIATDSEVDLRVRHAALVTLRERRDYIDVKRVKDAYTREDGSSTEIRAQLLLVLGASDDENIINTLISAVMEKSAIGSSRIREAALLAMHGYRATLIKSCILGALDDSDEVEVRKAACVAAAGSRYMEKDVCGKLKEIVENSEFPIDLRSVACEALCSQEPTGSLIKMLAKFAQDYRLPLTLRSYAMEGLSQSDDPDALLAMEEVARRNGDELQGDASALLAAMRVPRRRERRRARRPASDIAEVIRLRSRPRRDESDEAAI